MSSKIYWFKIWLLASILAILGVSFNETILRTANHQPSLVNDADLFCISYSQLANLGSKDVVLLGASRMQTNFDLNIFQKRFPGRKIIQLAQSGKGTAYPVFKEILETSDFRGIVIISETEYTLISQKNEQQEFINHCRDNFTLDSRMNRNLSTWLQNRFVFLNPHSSSLLVWENILARRHLPEPFYTKTKSDRSQLMDFQRARHKSLQKLHYSRLQDIKKTLANFSFNSQEWLVKTNVWQPLITKFQARGGQVIFVRMPISQKRWEFESKFFPPDRYWHQFTHDQNVLSWHFAEHPFFTEFNFPDTSHLDMHNRSLFTELLLDELKIK